MKKIMSFLIIVGIIFLTDCKRDTERVAITPNISVELPSNYKKNVSHGTSSLITNPELKVKSKLYYYRGRINEDEVIIIKTITKEFDNLNVEKKKERIKPLLEGYVRAINGRDLIHKEIHKEKSINGIAQGDFRYEAEIKDSLFIVFGRLIIQDTNLLFLNYRSKMPVTMSSIKEKENFLKSIKYN